MVLFKTGRVYMFYCKAMRLQTGITKDLLRSPCPSPLVNNVMSVIYTRQKKHSNKLQINKQRKKNSPVKSKLSVKTKND